MAVLDELQMKLGRVGGKAKRLGDISVPSTTKTWGHPRQGSSTQTPGPPPAPCPGLLLLVRVPGEPQPLPPPPGYGAGTGGGVGRINSHRLRCSCDSTAAEAIQQREVEEGWAGNIRNGCPWKGLPLFQVLGPAMGVLGQRMASAARLEIVSFPRWRPATLNHPSLSSLPQQPFLHGLLISLPHPQPPVLK